MASEWIEERYNAGFFTNEMDNIDDWDNAKHFVSFKSGLAIPDSDVEAWLTLGRVKAHADCLNLLLWFDFGPGYATATNKIRVAGFPRLQN